MEITAASVNDIPPGKMIGIETNGKEILIARTGGKYYAMGNSCTHKGCKLSNGNLNGENIECPCHGSTFNIKNGKVVKGPAKKPEPTFEVETDGKNITVKI